MIGTNRIFSFNEKSPNPDGAYVLYWMQIFRRLEYNAALQHAIEWANILRKPLLIYEGLGCDYPWASDRFHQFLLEGMIENRRLLNHAGHNYYSHVELEPGSGRGLVKTLCERACVLVTDYFPAFVIRRHNEQLGPQLTVPHIAVDSNGILPLQISPKAPYSAYHFHRLVQKHLKSALAHQPVKLPLSGLKVKRKVFPGKNVLTRWPDYDAKPEHVPELLNRIAIDHKVKPVPQFPGTRQEALRRWNRFSRRGLLKYAAFRNHPDLESTSRLSPYLHFGKISACEIVRKVLNKRKRFPRHPSMEAFLTQLITWREIGFHYCFHEPEYDQFASIPQWAQKTLAKHAKDARPVLYTLQELETAQTHDSIWNAAQKQLMQDGIIHNYLRMLWGKKILEWSPDPATALEWMIHLNNKYALDGRDPNSYSGIFWIFGRFDRPWGPERDIFGTVRWMSSENTARKVKLKMYLAKYS